MNEYGQSNETNNETTMTNTDVKNFGSEKEQKSVTENQIDKIKGVFNVFSNAFHKFGLWILISVAIGVYTGVTASKKFYTDKLSEVVQVGGMLHQGKVYTVTPK